MGSLQRKKDMLVEAGGGLKNDQTTDIKESGSMKKREENSRTRYKTNRNSEKKTKQKREKKERKPDEGVRQSTFAKKRITSDGLEPPTLKRCSAHPSETDTGGRPRANACRLQQAVQSPARVYLAHCK